MNWPRARAQETKEKDKKMEKGHFIITSVCGGTQRNANRK